MNYFKDMSIGSIFRDHIMGLFCLSHFRSFGKFSKIGGPTYRSVLIIAWQETEVRGKQRKRRGPTIIMRIPFTLGMRERGKPAITTGSGDGQKNKFQHMLREKC